MPGAGPARRCMAAASAATAASARVHTEKSAKLVCRSFPVEFRLPRCSSAEASAACRRTARSSASRVPVRAPARRHGPVDIYAYRMVRKTSAKKRQAVKMARMPEEIIMSMYILGGW